MSPPRLFHFLLVRLLTAVLAGLWGAHAMAQADPPSRVARLNHLEGAAVFSPAGDNEWIDVVLNRPLTRGDRIWIDKGSRADLQVGSSAVRLGGQTHLEILALDDRSARLSVTQGTVFVRVRSLPEGDNFEIDTPNLAYRAAYPGDYRIDVDAVHLTTRVTIHSGTGAVYGEGGQAQPLGGGQQITFSARTLAQMGTQESPPQDNFDRWASERNRREDQAVSARYVPREVVGYQQLDAHGQWAQDATYGNVWFPQGTPANWAPYRNGHWEWIAPWGWTWIDDAPWGFAPFHYGRWTLIGSRWAWVPGRIGLKPVYAPALVAFIGGSSGGIDWNISIGSGRAGVAWFPLAPGEAWQPGYPASPVYMSSVNSNLPLQANASYANQRKPEAIASLSAEDFDHGKPVRASWLRIAANTLTSAQIVPPPPMPERGRVITLARPAAARAVPPGQVQASAQAASHAQAGSQLASQPPAKSVAPARPAEPTKVAVPVAPVPQIALQPAAQAAQPKAANASRRAEPAKADEDAKRGLLARRVEQAKREQLTKHAEQGRREPAAKPATHARREQFAKQVEQTKRDKVAKREQARREQVAKRTDQARREEQARRAGQARREAVASRDEQQRREIHAQQVEKARRAAERDAQALREQRTEREEQQARREAQERDAAQQKEQAQRAALARQQQAISEQLRRDQMLWEQQQRDRARLRPDLRDDRRSRTSEQQRGVPIISSGPWN